MRMQDFSASPIDHFIQSDILSQLYTQSDQAFSDLKAGDIDNGLFMYHMRKLINRGVVEKSDNGFRLTEKGIRWINFIGPSTLQPRPLPRLLINFIVTDPVRENVLLSRRKGPAAALLNEYLLPGGLYPYGLPDQEAVRCILQEMNLPQDSVTTFVTQCEKIFHADDGFIHHSLSQIYALTLETTTKPDTEHFALEWIPIKDIQNDISDRYDHSILMIIRSFQAGNIEPRMCFDDSNS